MSDTQYQKAIGPAVPSLGARSSARRAAPTPSAKLAAHRFYAAAAIARDPLEDELMSAPRVTDRVEPNHNQLSDDAYHGLAAAPQDESALRGRLTDPAAIRAFVTAGHATLTIVSVATGGRFTFKFDQPDDANGGRPKPTFVKLLRGPDNTGDYQYCGAVFPDHPGELRARSKSPLGDQTPSIKALRWFLRVLEVRPDRLAEVEVWHEGRCGRCGRKLTVPSSIASGFGPECASRLG